MEAFDHYDRSDLHLPPTAKVGFSPHESPDCVIASVQIMGPRRGAAIRTGEVASIEVVAEFRKEMEVVAGVSILARDLLTIVATEHSGMLRRCTPGTHIFRFEIPELPLMPGLFHVRAFVREGERQLPVATLGVWNSPASFLVSGEPNAENVSGRARGQLFRIQGKWS